MAVRAPAQAALNDAKLAAAVRAYQQSPEGQTGMIRGADGATWTIGTGAPTATAKPDDLYLDVSTGDVYRNN
jgi:hypothetical protein